MAFILDRFFYNNIVMQRYWRYWKRNGFAHTLSLERPVVPNSRNFVQVLDISIFAPTWLEEVIFFRSRE